jgi:hypothetical protein
MSDLTSRPPSGLAQIDSWLSPGRFASLLGLLVFLGYSQVLLGLETFIFRDYGLYGYPVAFHFRESFWQGEVPLWNPWNSCGVPFLAQWATIILYPLSWFYLVFPLTWALGAFCLLHYWWSGMGMFFLARSLTRSQWAAGLAGIIYVFNGFMTNCLMWPHYLVVMGWCPWVIWLVRRAWIRGGISLLWAGLTGSLQLLGGAPEAIAFTWIIAGLLLVGDAVSGKVRFWTSMRRYLAIVAVVSLLSSGQLVPFFQLVYHSQRDTQFATGRWAMPATGWANFLVPLFNMDATSIGVYLQPNQSVTSSYYLGLMAMALVAIGLWKERTTRSALLSLMGILCLVLALGKDGYLYDLLLKTVPALGFVRYPVKFVIPLVMAAPLLAAAGLCRFEPKQRSDHWLLHGIALGEVLLVLIILGHAWRHPRAEGETHVLQCGLMRIVFLLAGLALYQGCLRSRTRQISLTCALSLLAIAWLDFRTHVPNQNPTVSASIFQPGFEPVDKLNPRPSLGAARAMLGQDALEGMKMMPDLFNTYLCTRLRQDDNCNLLDHTPNVDGFFSLYLRRTYAVQLRLFYLSNQVPDHLADFLGIGQTIIGRKSLDWVARPTWMPLISAGQRPLFLPENELLASLIERPFDPRHTVLISEQERTSLTHITNSPVTLANTQVTAHHIALDADGPAPFLVVIAQSDYPAWHATIDNKPTPITKANYACQAVAAPSGKHHIELNYQDRGFRLGMGVCLLLMASVLWVIKLNTA